MSGAVVDLELAAVRSPARSLSFEEFRLVVRRWEQLADLDGSHHDADVAQTERTMTLSERDGHVRLRASGAGIDAATLAEVHRRYLEAEFQADWEWTRRHHGDRAHAGRSHGRSPTRWCNRNAQRRSCLSTPQPLQEPRLRVHRDADGYWHTYRPDGTEIT